MDAKLSNKFVSFGALLMITGTGLAVITIGACLLSWDAYLSVWMPSWTFTALGGFTCLGVFIAAFSTSAAIATIAPNQSAAHKCLVVLLIVLGIEVGMLSFSVYNKPQWSANLYLGLRKTMYDSLGTYSSNDSSKAMWDEIQLEQMACCGVETYKDWFNPLFEDGMSVPDSCCLLPSVGCGKGVKHSLFINEIIDTKGCLPTIAEGWKHTYEVISKQALLPICIIQVIMVILITLSFRKAGVFAGQLPSIVRLTNIDDKKPLQPYITMP